MKSDHPRITLLGSNSGNNVGDAAILSGILDVVTKEMPDAEFFVPSTNPSFIDSNYGSTYNVKGVNVMPWTGSIRLLGIPTMHCMLKSDAALICDGIIFGKKLFNPMFNFLITLVFLVPWAKLTGCKLVCYSCGIGPFPSFWSRLFARWVINGSDLVIMREHDSRKLAEEIGVTKEIVVTGDAAFLNPVNDDERAKEIAKAEGIDLSTPQFGINVTKYIDSWLSKDERVGSKEEFLQTIADGINAANASLGGAFAPLIFSTHPMDEEFCLMLASKVGGKTIVSTKYLSHDIQAMMRQCNLFMGMRFHSVVLASAVYTPVVGLIYAPKVRGFMRLLKCEEYGLELKELNSQRLADRIARAWQEADILKIKQKLVIDELKTGARNAAVTLKTLCFPRYQTTSAEPRSAAVNY